MDSIEKKLTSHLYRIDCPPSEDLGEYHLNMLTNKQTQAVRQHVALCPHCSQELAQLATYLADLAPELEYSLREKVQIWVAQLMPSGFDAPLSPSVTPAMAFRGETNAPLMYEAGEYQLNLEIQDDPAMPEHKSILGLLIGGDGSIFEAELWQNGRFIQQTTIDDLGNFVFTNIQSGTYDLILSQHIAEIHVKSFRI